MGQGPQNLVSFRCTGPFVHDTDAPNSSGLMGGLETSPRGTPEIRVGDRVSRPGGGGGGEEEKGLLP